MGTFEKPGIGMAASVPHRHRASLSLKMRHQVPALLLSGWPACREDELKMKSGAWEWLEPRGPLVTFVRCQVLSWTMGHKGV